MAKVLPNFAGYFNSYGPGSTLDAEPTIGSRPTNDLYKSIPTGVNKFMKRYRFWVGFLYG
jgi:hypothetical protein